MMMRRKEGTKNIIGSYVGLEAWEGEERRDLPPCP
jgi:hypothetical protein